MFTSSGLVPLCRLLFLERLRGAICLLPSFCLCRFFLQGLELVFCSWLTNALFSLSEYKTGPGVLPACLDPHYVFMMVHYSDPNDAAAVRNAKPIFLLRTVETLRCHRPAEAACLSDYGLLGNLPGSADRI